MITLLLLLNSVLSYYFDWIWVIYNDGQIALPTLTLWFDWWQWWKLTRKKTPRKWHKYLLACQKLSYAHCTLAYKFSSNSFYDFCIACRWSCSFWPKFTWTSIYPLSRFNKNFHQICSATTVTRETNRGYPPPRTSLPELANWPPFLFLWTFSGLGRIQNPVILTVKVLDQLVLSMKAEKGCIG